MESTEVDDLMDNLEGNIDVLDSALASFTKHALAIQANKMPLLDRAKLYTLVVYSLESILFSYIRLKGINAKEHPVFKELARAKQYFLKVKIAEDGSIRPNLRLDKQAAERFIKNALAANTIYSNGREITLSNSMTDGSGNSKRRKRKLDEDVGQDLATTTDGSNSLFEDTQRSTSEQGADAERAARPKRKKKYERYC